MKAFRFQKFDIQQSKEVFRVGTDGVLLGALASVVNANSALEIGVGSGLISLMLAQRNSKIQIDGIDVNPKAVELTQQNFKESPFSERLHVFLSDFNEWKPEVKYDLIFSNPPYFEINDSEKDVLARQQKELSFSQLISNASNLLSKKGLFSVIIPAESSSEFENLAFENELHLNRKISIFEIENGPLKRVVLEFSREKRTLINEDFVIEKSPRKYSDCYLELTKEFHVFS